MASSTSLGKPCLAMVVEPENKFRFRYESESAKSTHGGILGKGRESAGQEGKKGSKKLYPTVKLENYHGKKPVVIRVSLYTVDPREKHVLELKGKSVQDGMHYQDLGTDNMAKFANLTIMNKKKEAVHKILMERKIGRLRAGNSGSAARRNLEKNSEIEIKTLAKQISNSAVLCFEAFTKDNPNVPICDKLFSEPIHNQKSSLKILRLSHCAGSWRGDTEVILLCDKVRKDAIKIVFSDGDDDYAWKAEGIFRPHDVHHQVAIPFKTPLYREDIETERSVNVYLCQGEERSDSVEFRYTPDSGPLRKRKRVVADEAEVPSVQQNLFFLNAVSPSSSSNGTSSDNLMEEPITMHVLNENGIDVCDNSYGSNVSQYSSFSQEVLCNHTLQEIIEGASEEDVSNFNGTSNLIDLLELGPEFNSIYPEGMKIDEFDFENPFEQFDDSEIVDNISNYSFVPSLVTDSAVTPRQLGKSLLNNLSQLSLTSNDDLLKHLKTNQRTSEIKHSTACEGNNSTQKQLINADMIDGTIYGQMCVEEKVHHLPQSFIPMKNAGKEKVARKNRLKNYYSSELKNKCSHLLSLRDESGNTILHLAVLHDKNVFTFLKMNKLSCCSDIVNKQNYNKQTAILLATEKNNIQHVRLLLKNGADPNIKNDEGNNCYHIASKNNFMHCLRELLQHPNLAGVDAFNYEGLSPLHIAVLKNSVGCFDSLLDVAVINTPDKKSGRTPLHYAVERSLLITDLLNQYDIDVNFQDFSGDSPLHVACTIGHTGIVKELLAAGADPLLRNFKHLEISEQQEKSENETTHNSTQEEMASNPDERLKNETVNGQTPLDVTTNAEIIEILRKSIQGEGSEFPDSDQCDCSVDASKTSESVLEKKLIEKLDDQLDTADWKKVVMYIGIDECFLDTILKCSPSPTKAVLSYLKRQNEESYLEVFENTLQMAGLSDVLNNVKGQ